MDDETIKDVFNYDPDIVYDALATLTEIQKIVLTKKFPDGSKIDKHSLEWLKQIIGEE